MKETKGKQIIVGLIIFLTGALCVFALLYFWPSAFSRSLVQVEKNVNINDTGIAEAVDKVYDAVVIVSTYKDNQLYASGTGFVYKNEKNKAYILTNNHVVSGGNSIRVTFTNGEVVETDVIGTDLLSDIAVLSVSSKNAIKVAEIGNSDKVKIGDTTFAVGAPLNSVYSWTVTRGILSGKDRMIEVNLSDSSGQYVMKALQTDAAINSGNSGGPLCNANGEVIGITSLKLVDTSVEGMGFAIPIEIALEYANKLEKGDKITQPYLGVAMYNVTDAIYYPQYYKIITDANISKGVIITEVEKNSPAEKAGLKSNDIIIKIEKNEISSIGYLRYYLYSYKPGDKVKMTFIRDGKEKTTTIVLGTNDKLY